MFGSKTSKSPNNSCAAPAFLTGRFSASRHTPVRADVKSCSQCGQTNDLGALFCTRCGFRFAPPPLRQKTREFPTVFVIILLLSAGTVAAKFAVGRFQLREVGVRFAAGLRQFDQPREREFNARRDADQKRADDEEAAQKARLADSAVVSGELARANHVKEWQKRLAHDPEFAESAFERAMLKMQKVGSDPSLAAREALEEVARLAAPPGSRIEVTNVQEKFSVRVAFKMSATTHGEAGASTKHRSTATMRREAEEISALVVKEVFDYCGARGIARLSVSCNHGLRHSNIPKAATDEERKELEKRSRTIMVCIYRIVIDESRAAFVPSWRDISIPRVKDMMHLDYDGITGLKLTDVVRGPAEEEDPNMPLEF
jgi:hypothetical protein